MVMIVVVSGFLKGRKRSDLAAVGSIWAQQAGKGGKSGCFLLR
jgi:hypothetical protein